MDAPSPVNSASGVTRTTSPPRVTTMCLTVASRATLTRCAAAWTDPASQSWMLTTVTWDPSSATISTVSVRATEPTWSITTTPSASASACTSRWVAAGSGSPSAPSPPSPWTRTLVAAEETDSRGRVTTVASRNEVQAVAAVRSPGLPAVPRRTSSRPTISTRASGASTTVTWTPVPVRPSPAASKSGARRATGEKRHSSSRPVGTVKSARSKEVRRAARDDSGVPPRPWVCAPSATALLWSVDRSVDIGVAGASPMVVVGSVVGTGISRRTLPSGAR